MLEKFKGYFGKLKRLSDGELDRSAEKLVRAEKQNVAKLIAHIAEMSRRKAALELGYKSTFHYCVERLHLSEGSVASRIHVANVSIRFPQLLLALAENRMSLTVAGLLAPHVSEDNVDTLVADCAGMTKKAALEYLVRLAPKPVFEPSVRKRPARPASPASNAPAEPPSPADPTRAVTTSQREPSPPSSSNILQPARTDAFNFRFSVDRTFKDKFERLAEVLGVENAQKHMVEIFEQGLDAALEKKDPKKKLERRKARQRRQQVTKTKSRPDEVSKNGAPRVDDAPPDSRYLSSEVVERVHARANHQCEYVSTDGIRCTARTGLQVDHRRPFAIFLSNDERWLRLLCPAHNRLTAEHVYGVELIQRKIDERRARRDR